MSSPEFSFRPYEDRDLPQVLDVMRAALGETDVLRRTPELFRWKHLDNPFGRSILLVAETSGRIAGLRAFMRWDLTTPEGVRVACARPVDTATHPDFQRMGLFRMLTEHAVDHARSSGIDLIFNTPNPQSGAGYRKMGWAIAGSFGVLARPCIRALSPLPEEFASPGHHWRRWFDDRPARGLRTVASEDYYRWRFLSHPTADYSVFGDDVGMCVVRWNVRGGRRERVISALYGEPAGPLTHALRVRGCTYTAAWFPPGSDERRRLVRRGMVPVPRVRSLTLAVRVLTDLPLDPTDLGNWDFSYSDLELL